MPSVTPIMHTGSSQSELSEHMPYGLRAPVELESHEQSWYYQLRKRCGSMRIKSMKMARQLLVGCHYARTATTLVFTPEGAGRPHGFAKGKG